MKAPTFLTLSCLTLFLALAATHARSDEPVPYPVGEQLSQKYRCIQCHASYKTLAGPSYHDIAKRYQSDPHARVDLGLKIVNGSSGAWGPTPMPPVAVAKGDVKPLVDWILSLTN